MTLLANKIEAKKVSANQHRPQSFENQYQSIEESVSFGNDFRKKKLDTRLLLKWKKQFAHVRNGSSSVSVQDIRFTFAIPYQK